MAENKFFSFQLNIFLHFKKRPKCSQKNVFSLIVKMSHLNMFISSDKIE